MAATAAESIGAVKVVHALSLEGTFARVFTGHSRKTLATGVIGTRLSASLERTVDVLIVTRDTISEVCLDLQADEPRRHERDR